MPSTVDAHIKDDGRAFLRPMNFGLLKQEEA